MSTLTTNYELVKPELDDTADITAMNPNWDKIDEELKKAVNKDGDVMNGSLTVIDNLNVNKTFDDVEYKTYIRPINYSIASNGDYSTGIIHYKGDTNQAQLIFNKDGMMLRDNVNGKAYQIYGQYNIDLLKNLFLPLAGGILSGNLDFKKVENGSGTIYKNHSETADYGMIFRDVAPNGNYNQIQMCANDNTLKYRDTAGKTYDIYGGHKTVPVSNGGTGATTFTSGSVLIGNGTGAVTTRAITNNTASTAVSGTNLTTCNTVNYHVANRLNRTDGVGAANTSYTTLMARGISLVTTAPSSLTNGCCAFVYA